jgi:hypothetical protein
MDAGPGPWVDGPVWHCEEWFSEDCRITKSMAKAFLAFDRRVEEAKDAEVAWREAQEHAGAWRQERADTYRIATSQPEPGTLEGLAMRYGEDWGVAGHACEQACFPQHVEETRTTRRYTAQRTALHVTIHGGLRPPCGGQCWNEPCECRTYSMDSTATMLALKFMIQGRTGQPAHSFWLLNAGGSRLTGGLTMQDRLTEQGVHQGTVLYISGGTTEAPRSVSDQACGDRLPDHWVDALNHQGRHGYRRGNGKAGREWAGSRGHRDMAKEWGVADTRAGVLMHRHKVGF